MAILNPHNGKPMASGFVPVPDIAKEIMDLECIDPESIRPTGCRVLLQVLGSSDIKTKSGLFMEESKVVSKIMSTTFAYLVKASDSSFVDHITGDFYPDSPKEGDKVITTKYAGNVYRDEEGNLYRFANDVDVVSVIKEEK